MYPASNNIDIVPVSRLTEHGVYNLTLKPSQLYTTKIVLAVSHVPVLPLNGKFSERVMNLINPDMIFSAHDHMGYWFSADRDTRHIKAEMDNELLGLYFLFERRVLGQTCMSDFMVLII